MVYRAMVRSVLDYGCLAYGGASPTTLARLDVAQAKALRVCCGAFRTTSVPALLVEVGETPLRLRRVKLALHYLKVGRTGAWPPREGVAGGQLGRG